MREAFAGEQRQTVQESKCCGSYYDWKFECLDDCSEARWICMNLVECVDTANNRSVLSDPDALFSDVRPLADRKTFHRRGGTRTRLGLGLSNAT